MQYPVFIYNVGTILFSFLHLIQQEKHMFRKLASVVESVICPHILGSLICFCLPSIDICWPAERICEEWQKNIYLEEKLIMCQEDLLSKERQIAHLESELRYWITEAVCFCLIKFMGNYALLAFWSLRSPTFFCIIRIMFVSLCLVNDDMHLVVCIYFRFVPCFFGCGQWC